MIREMPIATESYKNRSKKMNSEEEKEWEKKRDRKHHEKKGKE